MQALAELRLLDRLDLRLASRRLRGRHVRAVGRALTTRKRAHGALSCESVFVGKGGRVSFRRTRGPAEGSTAGGVSALARDLGARGAPRLAEQLAAAYALHADDYAVFGALDASGRQAPVAIAVGGLVASGKSTVAKYVARRIGAPRVVADRVRRALLAGAPGDGHELAWAPDLADRVYAGLLARAGEVLASGRAVVLDACF